MSLVLRRHRDPRILEVPNTDGVYRIEAEYTWVVEGPEALIDVARVELQEVSTRVHREVLHLAFGNTVGVFRVSGLGIIEVVSGKWSMNHFDAMLAEIAEIGSALPFAAGSAGPLPYDRALSAHEDLLYHCFVYVRHILSDTASRQVRLLPALRAIIANPHRRALHETVQTPVEQLHRVDETTILAIADSRGPFVHHRVSGLPGPLPRYLPEKRFCTTVDTVENRFVKAFLGAVSGVLTRTREACTKDTRFSRKTKLECEELAARLSPFIRHPLWKDVGQMHQLPASSTVLQRRRGYRDVLRHFILMRLSSRHMPISANQARDLLESKNIAALYELWCFFRVIKAFQTSNGAPSRVDSVSRTDFQAHVAREFQVGWSNGLTVTYNGAFSPDELGVRRSYSVELRPDVTVMFPNGTVHVFDAKFKLEWFDTDQDDDRADVRSNDVHKMHAYRDAIDAVKSAWVLYPGTELHEHFVDERAVSGVGAIPLRPEALGGRELEALLERMLSSELASGGDGLG